MIARLNYLVLVASVLLATYFYMKSARPALLARQLGTIAYIKCSQYRLLSLIFTWVAVFNYLIYGLFPLSLSLPNQFPWDSRISALIALLIAVPSLMIWWRGVQDAKGQNTIVSERPSLFGGIYHRIRHPQAIGQVPLWWVLSMVLNSPFLVIFSFVWVPMCVMMCWAEESDLSIRYGQAYDDYRKNTGAIFPKA